MCTQGQLAERADAKADQEKLQASLEFEVANLQDEIKIARESCHHKDEAARQLEAQGDSLSSQLQELTERYERVCQDEQVSRQDLSRLNEDLMIANNKVAEREQAVSGAHFFNLDLRFCFLQWVALCVD